MPYIGRSTDGFGVRNRFLYLASASDTSVSGADASGATLTFTDGAYVDVYLNGVLLKAGTDYNTNTANTIAGISSMSSNDEVTVIVYDVFTVGDMVSATSGGTFVGNVAMSGTLGVTGATTTAAITASGVIKTDDTTDSTSTTTGSIQTDGGLGVAKDVVVGDDLFLKSDSAAIQFGADSEITLTHSHDAGLSLRNSSSTGPVLNIGTTSTSVSDGGFIGGIMFDAGSSNTATARIQALASGTSEDGADISFECRDSGASFTEKFRIDGDGNVKVNEGNLVIGTSGKGIDFSATANTSTSGASMSSELFDYYEEGTWTPAAFGGTTAGSFSATTVAGVYTRIGRIVYCEVRISSGSLSSAAGTFQVSGLPFTIGGTQYGCSGSFALNTIDFDPSTIPVIQLGSGTQFYFLVSQDDTGWTTLNVGSFDSTFTLIGTFIYQTG